MLDSTDDCFLGRGWVSDLIATLLRRGNAAFWAGNYTHAAELYKRASVENPEIDWIYQFNVRLAEGRARKASRLKSVEYNAEPDKDLKGLRTGSLVRASECDCLRNRSIPVVASICSIPERENSFQYVLERVINQVDLVYVYLDRYLEPPSFLRQCDGRVVSCLSRDYPGLRDNGKFLPLEALGEGCYFVALDDDILYPSDYVAAMVKHVERYGRQAVVGVHGVRVPEQARNYFSGGRRVLPFWDRLQRDAGVNILGTGTVAFFSNLLCGLKLKNFRSAGMSDLYLAVFCKQARIPMIAVARPGDWLRELPTGRVSLFSEYRHADAVQSELVRQHGPWGHRSVRQAILAAACRTRNIGAYRSLRMLLSELDNSEY